MTLSLKKYKFDKLLKTEDIKFIDREIVNMAYQQVRCDRCNALLRYVNILRIEITYYNLGDNCYQSVKIVLSEIRGKSLHFIRVDLEESYERNLEKKYNMDLNPKPINSKRSDPEYTRYITLKWDKEHNSLHANKLEEYERLRRKFK